MSTGATNEPSAWTSLHDQVHQIIRQRHLLLPQQRLLVAVSGGQDSLCLIRLLLDLQPKWNWSVAIAHCNHRWRPDADANAEYVAQLAACWQIPQFSVRAEQIPTSEAAARQWRYDVLTDLALAHGFSAVLTGHTLSDRAETLLYNLMRGSGADGLQSLSWSRPLTSGIALVRPLLAVTRQETAQFCQQAQLRVWEDATNEDWRYARNRIRQELLPYLKTQFNPQVERSLAQTSELLRADVECLDAIAQTLYQQAVESRESSNVQMQINRLLLKSAPLAIQRRVMRRVLQQTLTTAPNFSQIEKLTNLVGAPNRSQTDPFPGGAIARVDGDWIVID